MSQSLVLLSVITAVLLAGCPKKPSVDQMRELSNQEVRKDPEEDGLVPEPETNPTVPESDQAEQPDQGVVPSPESQTDGASDAEVIEDFDIIGC